MLFWGRTTHPSLPKRYLLPLQGRTVHLSFPKRYPLPLVAVTEIWAPDAGKSSLLDDAGAPEQRENVKMAPSPASLAVEFQQAPRGGC